MDFPAAIEKYWTHATLAVGGFFAALKWLADQRAKKRTDAVAAAAARQVAKLDLLKLAREAAADTIQTLREEVDHWTGEVDKLRAELRELQAEHIAMIADKDAEIALLRGRNRQLEASIAAHRRMMIAAGMDLPAETAFFELREGELKPIVEVQ